mgnify:CR=1 FL=1
MTELDPVFDAVAAYFSVLSEPTRLKIMHAVCNGERSVSEIVLDGCRGAGAGPEHPGRVPSVGGRQLRGRDRHQRPPGA